MSKVTLRGHIVVSPVDLIPVKDALPVHIFLTLKEEGCLVFRVVQDSEDQHIFNVYEEFINREAFEYHQQRVRASQWGDVTKSVERHYEIIEEDA